MGCFTPYENFKTLTTNDLQFHSPIRFNQSGPGMPVSKITFHAHPYQTGLQPVLQWKVQTFPRTVHTAPHHTTFCGLLAWKVILFLWKKSELITIRPYNNLIIWLNLCKIVGFRQVIRLRNDRPAW